MVILFLASVFVIGSITGALVGGITGEKLGRKSALIIDNVIMIIGKVLSLIKKIYIEKLIVQLQYTINVLVFLYIKGNKLIISGQYY